MWRRKWLLLVPLIACSVAAYAIAQRMPNRYRSETVILVVPQRIPESYVRSTVTSRIEDRLRTITQEILSRTRLEQVIKEFDLYAEERKRAPMEAVVEQMRSHVDPQISRADSFRLAFEYTDPVLTMKVTERLASLYVQENLRNRAVQADSTNQFLEQQLDDARARLLDQEKKIETYRLRHSGELPAQLPLNVQMIQNLQMQIQSLLESVNRDRDRLGVVDRLLADAAIPDMARPEVPLAGGADTPITTESVSQQFRTAEAQLRSLEARLTPQHPDVIRLRRRVADLEAKVRSEEASRPAGTDGPAQSGVAVSAAESARQNRTSALRAERVNLERQISARQREEQELRAKIADYQSRVEMVPTRESEMISLTRDYETLQQSYRALLTKKEESQIAANLERQQSGEQFRVIDPARVPDAPFSPNRMRVSLIGAALGLFLGLALIGFFEVRYSTFMTDEDVVQVLDLRVLAVVPFVLSAAEQRRRYYLKLAMTATIVVVSVLAASWSAWF
jgi:polysaccharide chain length determinant protein (PEP-CTERM system associated)